MRLFNIRECNGEKAGYMAIGFFDSIHLGHKKVIERAVSFAREHHSISSVFLFRNNIYELIGVNKSPLFSFEERIREIERSGIDIIFYLDADKAFLDLSPEDFVSFLRSRLRIDGIICGADFTYGRDGIGKAEDILRAFPNGEIVDLYYLSNKKVSTSSLKDFLLQGDIRTVNQMLGRPFSFAQKVVAGRSDGKKIGFPTINMPFPSGIVRDGVYISETVVNGSVYQSLTNIGSHPTYNDTRENAETYILDFDGTLYGESPTINLLDRLRDIKRFDSVQALIEQIEKDVVIRRNYDPIRTIGN